MGFDYEELRDSDQNEKQWATYSDLFMVLSLVFLLLYTVSSLRSGAFNIHKQLQFQKLEADNEDLRQQLEVYNTLKDDYLEKGASKDEENTYVTLMNQLELLQDQTSKKKVELRQKATENEEKEMALNKYQQLIRNIVNSNMLAQARIKRRDEKIKSVRKKSNQRLTQQRKKSKKRLKSLKKETQKIAKVLLTTNKDLGEIRDELVDAQSQIMKQQKEKSYLVTQLDRKKREFELEKAALEEKQNQISQEQREKLELQLSQQKLSANARKQELQKFKKQMEQTKAENNRKLSELNEKITQTRGALKKAEALANARQKMAKQISQAFARSGLKAKVDAKTGDVEIDFGDEYFDTGKYMLKTKMKDTLKKFVPLYANTLFSNAKISKKIKNVEIVGFASPTFKGKFVDPKSLDSSDRRAVDYNLDLSYYRARSIFKYIFDKNEMPKYKHQKRLLPLVKVTGRSFLAEKISNRELANQNMSAKEFCLKFDCKKAQKVIIKFNLEE